VIEPVPIVARACALIDRAAPDFAILDVNLGRQRTTPIAETLRSRGVPFILATRYTARQWPEEVFRNATHLGKPLDHRRLAGALARLGKEDR